MPAAKKTKKTVPNSAAHKNKRKENVKTDKIPGKNGGTLNRGGPGRPKGSQNLKTIVERVLALEMPASVLTNQIKKFGVENPTVKDAMVVSLVKSVLEDANNKNAALLFAYCDGLPVQKMQHLGDPDKPIYSVQVSDQDREKAKEKLEAIKQLRYKSN